MSTFAERLYNRIFGDEGDRVYTDISEDARAGVPQNFLKLLIAFTASRTGDGLSKPGLILTWLLTSLGAPLSAIALLAPVREAGSLVLQLFVAAILQQSSLRKRFWVVGSLLQGFAVLGMAAAAYTLQGGAAGWAIIACLLVFSLSRGICSIASKELLGKTIPKTRRGRLNGLASSVAAWVSVGLGLFFTLNPRDAVPVSFLVALLLAAGVLWICAALAMARLDEPASPVHKVDRPFRAAWNHIHYLKTDPAFRRFCLARALLASTVISMPFYVVLAHEATGGKAMSFGVLMLVGSAATAVSAVVWGRFADRSSRFTLSVAGIAAGLIGLLTAWLAGIALSPIQAICAYALVFFLIGLAHTGIRLGRKTYLVDMATSETRAAYVAVSNTLIGIVLIASGSFGILADALGTRAIILVFALLGLAGGVLAARLPEVTQA